MKTITQKNWNKAVLESELPILVDFSAKWCMPCQQMVPILEKLETDLQDVVLFGKVDIDKAESLAEDCHIRSVPTLLLYVGGKKKGMAFGTRNRREVLRLLREALPDAKIPGR
jgi:thioredoxin 1